MKNWLVGKDPHSGKDWRQEGKGTTEGEIVGWHHWLNGHEFEQALGVGDGQGGLVCCSPWGCKESDMTELNWTEKPSDCSHSLWWALRKLWMWKHRILAPNHWGAYQRNDFSEPRLLQLPIYRKALNSLAWDIWFSLLNNNLLMIRLPALLYNLAPLLAFSE